MAFLVNSSTNPPIRHEIRGVAIIGRDRNCDIQIDDKRSSRRNAKVYTDGRRYLLEDLGSRNGTLLNGMKVRGVQPLRPGDQIRIGNTLLVFEDPEARRAAAKRGPRLRTRPDDTEEVFLSIFTAFLALLIFGTTTVLSKLLFVFILRGL